MSSSAAIKFPPQASAPVSGIRGSEPPSVSRKAISPVDAVFTPPTKKWVETVRKSSEDLDNNNQIQTLSPLPKKADADYRALQGSLWQASSSGLDRWLRQSSSVQSG